MAPTIRCVFWLKGTGTKLFFWDGCECVKVISLGLNLHNVIGLNVHLLSVHLDLPRTDMAIFSQSKLSLVRLLKHWLTSRQNCYIDKLNDDDALYMDTAR